MSDMEDKEVRRQKREGERREEEERKPLKKWTAEEVKAWFNFYREGKYAEFYEGFTDLDGEEMLGLSEEKYRNFAKNEAKGIAIYNVFIGLFFFFFLVSLLNTTRTNLSSSNRHCLCTGRERYFHFVVIVLRFSDSYILSQMSKVTPKYYLHICASYQISNRTRSS